MKFSRALFAAVVSAIVALSLCSNARAANVTIGPNLSGGHEWLWEECEFTTCVFVNTNLAGTGPNLTSPVSGMIVRFSVIGGATPGIYRLSALTQGIEALLRPSILGAPVTVVPSEGVETYLTSLPIMAGQTIGLSMSKGASVAFLEHVGGFCGWGSDPLSSGPGENDSKVIEFCEPEVAGFNAVIRPAPTISSLGATSGSTAGGTSVTISGTDLEDATGVTFGSSPAASYTVDSESQISAVTPASASAASVPVSVTTVAGKATASQAFMYEVPPAPVPVVTTPPPAYCVVPTLTGKNLMAATKALANAKCKLGAVRKRDGATAKSGRVFKQSSKPKSHLPVDSMVGVTLKPAKPAAKKHGGK